MAIEFTVGPCAPPWGDRGLFLTAFRECPRDAIDSSSRGTHTGIVPRAVRSQR